MIWLELAVLLGMILLGAQLKGIGLGLTGIIGMFLFVFVFKMRPADPPLDVMMIILCIVTTAATLQAAGGLDYLVSVAGKIIRSNPGRITFIAPLTTYCLCLFAGTSHLVYSLLPIVADVSTKRRIRPERPISMTVIAAHMALTGSPMSAATASFAAILAYSGASLHIMAVCIPACIVGILVGCLFVRKRGVELDQEPTFLEKMQDPAFAAYVNADADASTKALKPGAKTSVAIFGLAILTVVVFGAFPSLVPAMGAGKANFSVNADGSLKMGTIIEIVTLAAAAIMLLVTKTSTKQVAEASLFNSMATAVVSVFGVVWMSATFMLANQAQLESALGGISKAYPWTFSIAVYIMAAFMFSQAATTKTMMPLGLSLGLAHPSLIAIFPAVNSDFVLPGYPTLLAGINFDRTGSTKIGKFVINHSFMLPGTITVAVAIGIGFLLVRFL
jgi:anaerobic C4-dicarboxylate transporter DcuA